MRIWTPTCGDKQYFLTIYFRETGVPNFLRIGRQTLSFGKGREFAGRLARTQVEVISNDGDSSIELFPGAKILGLVLHDQSGVNLQYQSTLNPKFDEVELVRPSEIVTMPADLAKEVAGESGNANFKKQIEILNGKRRRYVGK